ncbi:hypothetical protein DL89DRAFT_41577 [Linderina pennispora]|uniref:Uncharacterized protein n=1 Tax=Linderina pennispora TaxID=61395 RepID=A0A1Y1VSK5_9FUNG|nr:uncharacterized protein DL89DRAFT_41577 [Linderina pennispora]ORX64257.1 hypothetical protein DL89DRAFT_41577 [Linderina pennispora]
MSVPLSLLSTFCEAPASTPQICTTPPFSASNFVPLHVWWHERLMGCLCALPTLRMYAHYPFPLLPPSLYPYDCGAVRVPLRVSPGDEPVRLARYLAWFTCVPPLCPSPPFLHHPFHLFI